MSIDAELRDRSEAQCELCGNAGGLDIFAVSPGSGSSVEDCILLCDTCRAQILNEQDLDIHHWRCLTESMWSQIPAVQVMAWRMLTRLQAEAWARDALEMMYLDDETLAWAQVTEAAAEQEDAVLHKDSNGAILNTGDTVVLIKDLNVKGAGFTAKRGTAVRGISLVSDNAAQIEGRVEGQKIVLLTAFVKKST
jgi:protein PhnA